MQKKTPFNNIIVILGNGKAQLQYLTTYHKDNIRSVQLNEALVDTYLQCEANLLKINPKLRSAYSTVTDCSAFAKSFYKFNTENQREVFWFYFQANSFRIQISKEKCNLLNLFYQSHKEQFASIFNIFDEKLEITNYHDLGTNCIFTNTVNKIVWYNFNFVNSDPIPLLFEFFKELPIIRP